MAVSPAGGRRRADAVGAQDLRLAQLGAPCNVCERDNPIYASIIYFMWAGQVEAPSAPAIGLALAGTLGLYLRMLIEESFLTARYPGYAEYIRRAKRLIPFVF